MESTPQVVVPLSPTTVKGFHDETRVVSTLSPFTFRPKYILVPHDVGKDFTISRFMVDDQAAAEWAPGEIPASVFAGDCAPYLIMNPPSRPTLDQPVPLKLPLVKRGQHVGLEVTNYFPAARNFSAVVLGELVE